MVSITCNITIYNTVVYWLLQQTVDVHISSLQKELYSLRLHSFLLYFLIANKCLRVVCSKYVYLERLMDSSRKVLCGTIVFTYDSEISTVSAVWHANFLLRFHVHSVMLWKFRHRSTYLYNENVHRFVEMSITVPTCIGVYAISGSNFDKKQ